MDAISFTNSLSKKNYFYKLSETVRTSYLREKVVVR